MSAGDFTDLTPGRCAVVVVDVQNDFCHPNGAVARMGNDVTRVAAAVPAVQCLIELARAADVPRIYLQTELSPWFDDRAWRQRGRQGGVFDADRIPVCRPGTWGAELCGLEPAPDELVIVKYRYSAFAYTPLELALRTANRDIVVLAGTATHQCVEATARDAIGRGFYPVLVETASASRDHRLHQAAVEDFAAHLGSVVALADLDAAWQANPDPARVREVEVT